ncbi:hypothetical protein BSLG_005477 [Batrachochytrium salamandrivorans]|nr:hypothetical protein BSLG_005477 [Batrachochytrium salamandrivorans]
MTHTSTLSPDRNVSSRESDASDLKYTATSPDMGSRNTIAVTPAGKEDNGASLDTIVTETHNQPTSQMPHTLRVRHRIKQLDNTGKSSIKENFATNHPLTQLAIPTPGPLDYEPKLPPSGVHYSILGKHSSEKEEKNNIGPGPSKYDIRTIKLPYSDTPHWSFGYKLEDAKENETPGPDRYLPKSEFGPTGTRPKYSFGLKKLQIDESTPGPLDYHIQNGSATVAKGPSFTMRRRLDDYSLNKDIKPGPNEYHPKLAPSKKMASLKGMPKEIKSLKTPGPANYIIPENMSSGPHYTLTARNIPYQENEYVGPNPGPSDYSPDVKPTLSKGAMFSFGSRPRSSKYSGDGIPGPCTYQPQDRQIRGNDKTPGPADYIHHTPIVNPTAAQLSRNSSKHSTGAERLKNTIEKTPGPADYQLKSMSIVKTSGPKYTLRKRLESQKIDQTPGPNMYCVVPKNSGVSVSMKGRPSPYVLVFPSTRVDTLRI